MFGFMGYMEIPLNIGTTMAAAIAIGIAVDDTLHFMLRYNRELKARKNHNIAMEHSIYGEALPVVSTSIALIAGFLVFTQASFEPIVQFGALGHWLSPPLWWPISSSHRLPSHPCGWSPSGTCFPCA